MLADFCHRHSDLPRKPSKKNQGIVHFFPEASGKHCSKLMPNEKYKTFSILSNQEPVIKISMVKNRYRSPGGYDTVKIEIW